jgi:hypothetical protein
MRLKRHNQIIAVCQALRSDSLETKHGLDFTNYFDDDLYEVIEDCTGYHLSNIEKRLAVVGFEQGADIAKKCIWYG